MQFEIIVDHGETANKCTIVPLEYRSDFYLRFGTVTGPLRADVLLHHNGTPLHQLSVKERMVTRVGVIDCVWRRLAPILDRLEKPLPALVSIPAGFVTAYPRRSKKDFDPAGGLATIEAIFIAAAFLGHWDETLLREYYFAERFLKENDAAFRRYGIIPPLVQKPVYRPTVAKTSHQRRLGRGRSGKKKQEGPT